MKRCKDELVEGHKGTRVKVHNGKRVCENIGDRTQMG